MRFYTTRPEEMELALPETESVSEGLLFVLRSDAFRASVPGVFVDDEAGLLRLVLEGGDWSSVEEELTIRGAGGREVVVRLHRATGEHPYHVVAATWLGGDVEADCCVGTAVREGTCCAPGCSECAPACPCHC